MTIRHLLLAASAALMLSTPLAAMAQQSAPAKPSPQQVQRTPKSIECSRLADEKGLKGKPRKAFRSACKKGKTPA